MKKKILAAVLTLAMVLSSFTIMAEDNDFSGKIWIAGDSIASDHSDNREGHERPLVGWGEVIGEYLKDVEVHNEARSGRSSKSYTKEDNYDTIMDEIGKGDLFFIQFGHNDSVAGNKKVYTDPAGSTETEGAYKNYLAKFYIDPALEAGAHPVLLSSVARYTPENGKLPEQEHKAYKEAMEQLVEEYAAKGITIPYIDCQTYTIDLYNSDIEGAAAYHAMTTEDGVNTLDTTHYCELGARNMAMYILSQCAQMDLYLRPYVTGFAVINGAVYQERKKESLFDWVEAA